MTQSHIAPQALHNVDFDDLDWESVGEQVADMFENLAVPEVPEEVFDTEARDGELMRVEIYSLDDDDEQMYARELRRCCGDDVAAEELS